MAAGNGELLLMAVGDVGPYHEPLDGYPVLAKPTLAQADLRFAHCEKVFSNRGTMQVHSDGHYSRQDPRFASLFADCGFDVVSVAGNKAMDWGVEALLDMIELFRSMGIRTVGGGRDEEEARRPTVIERNGVSVAFLAYNSIMREGYAATAHRAGIAPMRVDTFYKPDDWQPGTPPRVVTIPWERDLNAMRHDVALARSLADAVVVSMHWGIHNIPRMLADYQRVVAREIIGAGADLIVGHHPHIPKGIEVIDGKVCFYSLSHFIWSQRELGNHVPGHTGGHRHGVVHDPAYPRLPMGPDAMKSMIGCATVTQRGVQRVSALPVWIDTELRPEVLPEDHARFAPMVDHLEWMSEGLPHTFTVEGDELVITAGKEDAEVGGPHA
jgi:poly-gamma-glutamate synthesis protein (capsule biosynthesis protein)